MKFELINLPRSCRNEEVIAEIRRVDMIVNKDVLTQEDYNKHGKMSPSGIKDRFGNWQKALIAVGLGHKYSGLKISEKMRQQTKRFADEEILNELKAIAERLNQEYVSQEDINLNSEIISASTVINRFGTWANGIEKAGLKKAPGYRGKFSNEEYFENLLNVWTQHGRQPLYRWMDESPSVISSGAYERRFGSWRKALEAFVVRMNKEENNATRESRKETNRETITQKEHKPIDNNQNNNRNLTKGIKVFTENHRGISVSLRYKVLSRDAFKCVKCGSSPATDHNCKLHIDHIVPFSKAGRTVLNNLQTLCENCNLGKGDRLFT